jgi:hypothetical protein
LPLRRTVDVVTAAFQSHCHGVLLLCGLIFIVATLGPVLIPLQ